MDKQAQAGRKASTIKNQNPTASYRLQQPIDIIQLKHKANITITKTNNLRNHLSYPIMNFHKIVCLIALIANVADAFTSQPRSRRALISSHSRSTTIIKATEEEGEPAKKKRKTKKKKAVAKKKKAVAKKDEVETFRKPEFVASIAEKTGMSKADSEAALAAVLETITEVCYFSFIVFHFCFNKS